MPQVKKKTTPKRTRSKARKRAVTPEKASVENSTSSAAAPVASTVTITRPATVSSAARDASVQGGGVWRTRGLIVVAIALVAVVLMMLGGGASEVPLPATNACRCAAAAHRELTGSHRTLIGSLLRQREGVNGMQVQSSQTRAHIAQWLAGQAPCAKAVVVKTPTKNVKQLAETLRKPFASAAKSGGGVCVVWLVSEETIIDVANSLKELLEKNTLQGDTVVPPGSHGILLLVSPKDRDGLKQTLPHRVVHMFSSLDLRDSV